MESILPGNEFKYWLTYKGDRVEVRAPKDWDSDSIGNFKRDEKYFGLMRTFGDEHQFVLNGRIICLKAFLEFGYEAEVLFEVERLDRTTFEYYPLFKSNLDFSQWRDDGTTCRVKMMESGISANIKAKESTKYEYPLTGLDVVNIVIPGVVFSEKADFINPAETWVGTANFLPKIDLINNDTNSGFVTVQNTQRENLPTNNPTVNGSPNWFAKGNRPQAFEVVVEGFLKGISNSPFTLNILSHNNTNKGEKVFGGNGAFNETFKFTTTISNGEQFYYFIRKNALLPTVIEEGEFKISYTQISDPSNCKGIKAFDLYKRIINRIAPQQGIDSSMIKNNWGNLIITCGNAIRELPNASIQTTLSDFFDTFNSLELAGMGVDINVLRIEQRPYFYRPYKIAELDDLEDCEFSVATDSVFNVLDIGYKDGNTDDIDGQYEFNSLQQYAMPISRIQRKESWISPYRADQFGIEKLRVDFIKKTNDTSSDNDVFMFDCKFDGVNYYPITGADYVSVSGMANEQANLSAYNLRLSPKEMLLRHSAYLASMLYAYPGRYVEFASAEKNKELVYTIPGNPNKTIIQKASVLIGSFPDAYFVPIIATITTKLPRDFMQLMDSGRFGFVEFEWDSQKYKGYVLEVGIDLAKNRERELRLLLTYDNTMFLP